MQALVDVHGVTGAARAECLDGVVNRLVQIDEALRIVRRCVACLRRRTAGDVAQCAQPGGGVRSSVRRSPGARRGSRQSANASVRSRSGDRPATFDCSPGSADRSYRSAIGNSMYFSRIDEHAGQRAYPRLSVADIASK